MSAYSDEQSEDGELARSPAPHMDFSLSEDEPDTGDSLDIKPPQAKLRADRIKDERRSRHVKTDRRKDHSRSHKKHVYRDREQADQRTKRDADVVKHSDREQFHNKEYYRDREYPREKEIYRDKDAYRAREQHYKDKEYKEKDAYRETDPYREKDVYRDKEAYRINKEAYRDRDHHKDKETFRDKEFYRDKESYREKDPYREKDNYLVREMREKDRSRHGDGDRPKSHRHVDVDRKALSREDARLRHIEDNNRLKDQTIRYVEKENREKPGDKELEDLRSRLLIKRQTKEQQEVSRKQEENSDENEDRDLLRSSRLPELDKSQLERREKLLKTEREMSHRKKTSRAALAARREKLKEDGAKNSNPTSPVPHKKRRYHSDPNSPSAITPEDVVMVSDESDVEIKSEGSQRSNNSDGTGSSSDSSSETSAEESETDEEEEDEEEDEDNAVDKNDEPNHKSKQSVQKENKTKEDDDGNSTDPPTPNAIDTSPASTHSITPKHSLNFFERSRSRSRSHSFSPPPTNENGTEDPEPVAEQPPKSPSPAPVEEKDDLPPYYPGLQGCRSVEEFQCLNKIEEGTYGVVYRARDKTTDEIVALKRLKMEKEKEGFPITSLREINTLLKGQHPNIVTVREIVVGSNMDKIFIVMDYVEHDLKGLMETMRSRKQVFLPGEVKCLMQQLLRAVDHLHDNWILHRDLKTSNLLLSHKGILKVGDFGLAREYGSPLKSYTPIVVTLWYRAPELLLGARQYSTPIDIWSVGCIFAEFIAMNALFPGKSEVDQVNRIFKELGTPNEKIWPGWSSLSGARATWADQPGRGLRFRVGQNISELGLDLLSSLLTYDPQQRATANQALNHLYFKEHPLAIDPGMFPTWPAKSEGGRRHQHSPKPPSGGDQYKMLKEDDQAALGFHMNAPGPALMTSYLPPSTGFSLKF